MSDVYTNADDALTTAESLLAEVTTKFVEEDIPVKSSSIKSSIASSKSNLNNRADSTDTKLQTGKDEFLGDLEDWIKSVNSEMQEYEEQINQQLADINTQHRNTITTTLDGVDTMLKKEADAANAYAAAASQQAEAGLASANTKLANYADAKKYAWQGGTKASGNFRGRKQLALGRLDWDLSGGKFKLATNKQAFEILEDGLYRLVWWTSMQGNNCYANARVTLNGKCASGKNGQSWGRGYGSYWRDMHLDHTWTYKKGDKVGVVVDSCGQGWSSGNTANKLTFEHVGKTSAKPRASVYNC
jgi:hypothetical protein